MSYGNLGSLKGLRKSDKYKAMIESLMSLSKETLERMETLFPIPLEDYSKMDKAYEDEYIAIIVGTLNRYNGTVCKKFKFQEYPARLEFYAVIGVDSGDGKQSFVISYKEFLEYLLHGEKDELTIKAINPNLNRLGKMLYGESIRSVVNEMDGWFVGHLTDNHTHLFRKNTGQEYSKDKLQDGELESSEDWLDVEFQSEIKNAFQLYQDSKYPVDRSYTSSSCISLFRMMQVIEIVESDKSGIQGYGFTAEEGLVIEQPKESSIDYLVTKFSTEETLSTLVKIGEYTVLSEIAYTILEVAKDNCFTNDMCLLLKGVIAEIYYSVYKDPAEDNVPSYKIARTLIQRNISLEQLINEFQEAKSKWKVEEIDRKTIWDYMPSYFTDNNMLLTAKDRRANSFLLYDGRDKTMTPYGKALCLKYKLNMNKIYEYKNLLKNVECSEELKGEAAAIIVAQIGGFKIPNHERVPRDYFSYFKEKPMAIQDVLKGR